jgi:hypothetical protein
MGVFPVLHHIALNELGHSGAAALQWLSSFFRRNSNRSTFSKHSAVAHEQFSMVRHNGECQMSLQAE